ncbi:hypothetical protein DSM104299_04314 [Baekduia alba]|uniref:hypothetical protein n=1 Tax=Baekduia alba TaxID=2997333 RepID=UPI0023417B7B|nr:hypothetical protein [Baekduia alba]WCB95565.1 hypothetical protein DSM104299_04314 [Baekduia alba]
MRRATILLATLALLGVLGVAAALAATAPPKPQVATDAKGDVRSPLDIKRVSLSRSADGRLRASITLTDPWDAKDLLADSGPPGSVCLKAWTTTAPPDTTPDYLACATADKDGELRGSILQERANKLPARTGSADVTRPSDATVTLRFSQTAIGKPATLYAAAETTRPGCPRGSCIDLAPDAPKTLTLKLQEPAK